MNTHRGLILFIFLIFAQVSWSQSIIDKNTINKLDAYYQKSFDEWNLPGMAIALVKDGKIIYSKGFGVKSVATGKKVDTKTNFAIASNTKAFTTAALATLVDAGKLNWDDKVRDYLPYFTLYDEYVSAHFTIRDLVSHRSGLETFSGDLIWYGTNYSREEVIRRARFLKPKYEFRAHYGYQNIMFIAAGEIVAKVSGMSWDNYVKKTFFAPLKMNTTITSVTDIQPRDNIALPHNTNNGVNHVIDWVNWDNIGGAGTILSNVDELSNWLITQLNRGVFGKDTLWSKARSKEMWSLTTPEEISNCRNNKTPSMTFSGYALGWEVSNLHGHKIVSHGGGYDGMISKTLLVPDENFGMVVLTNSNNWLPGALTNQTLDMLYGNGEDLDWSKMYLDFKTSRDESEEKARKKAEEARIKNTKPSLPLADYAGTYGGEMYGNCTVEVEGDHLKFQFLPTPLFRGTMTHWHFDTFQLNWSTDMMLPSGTVQFILNPEGKVDEMKIVVPNPDFYFEELKFLKLD